MAITIEPASSSYDEQVRQLFADSGVPVLPEYWRRHYSPQHPEGPSLPFVALDEVIGVVGFMAIRTIELDVMGDRISAGLVHDLVVADHAAQGDVPGIMMQEALGRSGLTLVCGAGLAQTRILGAQHFLRAGHYHRAVADPNAEIPGHAGGRGPLELHPMPDVPQHADSFNAEMSEERRIFRPRTTERLAWAFRGPATDYEILGSAQEDAISSYAVIKRVEGRAGEELIVVDFACRALDMRRFAMALAKVAIDRDRPLHLPVFGDRWKAPLGEAGFRFLPPRWPVHWMLSDQKLRVLGNSLLRTDSWFFTAADGELDMW